MLGQLKIGFDGEIRDKIEASINRLQVMCPPEGFYCPFCGQKLRWKNYNELVKTHERLKLKDGDGK